MYKFDASNRYAVIKEGHCYNITTTGIRYPLLSWFPNIIEVKEVNYTGDYI